jgi:hypothetical protein
MKILLLSEQLRDLKTELLKPCYIQISKELKVADLREQILSSFTSLTTENTSNTNNLTIKMYLIPFALKTKKKEIFEVIYSYRSGEKSFRLQGEEITDDQISIEVIFI